VKTLTSQWENLEILIVDTAMSELIISTTKRVICKLVKY